MLRVIGMMYVTLVPTILAGVMVMLWCKLPILKAIAKPIDFGKNFTDGRRIFGDNKTWKGMLGYILFNTLFSVLWGFACQGKALHDLNFFYQYQENTIPFNLLIGVLLGLGYSLFELPNSFLKFGFQAPEFYKKLGYEIELVREDKEPKLSKYFLAKQL